MSMTSNHRDECNEPIIFLTIIASVTTTTQIEITIIQANIWQKMNHESPDDSQSPITRQTTTIAAPIDNEITLNKIRYYKNFYT